MSERREAGDARERAPALRRALLSWYRRSRRSLPWRKAADAYRVWVSEVMLQQTTVRAVTPYYERFLARFPDVEALAAASEENVLAAWSGLGYYHRARNLRRGAQHLLEHHGGRFPRTLEAALAVPGVGLYTASAVLSIAHGLALPVVDGNVRRVLARLFALRGGRYRRDGPFYNLAETLLAPEAPGDFNQALMDLGATLCLPRRPACDACPLRDGCLARERGLTERLPEPRRRRAAQDVSVAAALVERDGRLLLVRRPEGRLLGRLWELPQTGLDEKGDAATLAAALRERHGLAVELGALVVRARHAVTFRRIELLGYRARLRGRLPREDGESLRWARPDELDSLPLSSMTRKLARGYARAQLPLELGLDRGRNRRPDLK